MKKYDVAISVAVEDKAVAKQILAELEKLKVRVYYYEAVPDGGWGKHILDLTLGAYGKHTRYVLLITSATFVTKYWSRIETQVAITQVKKNCILQLRLDDTKVDGISEHVVYKDWKKNPEEIAQVLYEMVEIDKRPSRDMRLRIFTFSMILIITAAIWGYVINRKIDIRKKVLVELSEDTFYISSVEVTVADYRAYCLHNKKPFPEQPPTSCNNGPVRNVTWDEAKAYCEAHGGRLPRETEWESAALAGKSTIYSGGTSAQYVAVYGRAKPAEIGSRKPNAWCIYDMSGNVAEWCSDWVDSSNTTKVVKGGGYVSEVTELRVDSRRAEKPDGRFKDIGFRVAWDKKPNNNLYEKTVMLFSAFAVYVGL